MGAMGKADDTQTFSVLRFDAHPRNARLPQSLSAFTRARIITRPRMVVEQSVSVSDRLSVGNGARQQPADHEPHEEEAHEPDQAAWRREKAKAPSFLGKAGRARRGHAG